MSVRDLDGTVSYAILVVMMISKFSFLDGFFAFIRRAGYV